VAGLGPKREIFYFSDNVVKNILVNSFIAERGLHCSERFCSIVKIYEEDYETQMADN
jgi:hypothetical protein